MIKHPLRTTLLATTLITAPLAGHSAEFLPVAGSNYSANPTLSLTLGSANIDLSNIDSDVAYGAELAFDCPLLQLDSGTIRQQASITRFDEDGVETTSFELNPHYLVKVNDRFSVGFGPGIGYVDASVNSADDGVWAIQAGASAHFNMGAIFLGAELRQQWTQEENFGFTRKRDVDNTRFMLKAGINF
jgi:hypothetical protein